jgi:hypothetical protein
VGNYPVQTELTVLIVKLASIIITMLHVWHVKQVDMHPKLYQDRVWCVELGSKLTIEQEQPAAYPVLLVSIQQKSQPHAHHVRLVNGVLIQLLNAQIVVWVLMLPVLKPQVVRVVPQASIPIKLVLRNVHSAVWVNINLRQDNRCAWIVLLEAMQALKVQFYVQTAR